MVEKTSQKRICKKMFEKEATRRWKLIRPLLLIELMLTRDDGVADAGDSNSG